LVVHDSVAREGKAYSSAKPVYFPKRKKSDEGPAGRENDEVHNKPAELTDNVGFAGVATPIPPFLETV